MGNQLDEPERLHGFPESTRGSGGHPSADSGDLEQLLFALLVRLSLGFLLCQICVSFRESGHGVENHDHGLIEGVLSHICRPLRHVEAFHPAPSFLCQAFRSLPKDTLVVQEKVPDSLGEVEANIENSPVKRTLLLRGQGRKYPVLHASPSPIGENLLCEQCRIGSIETELFRSFPD